MDTISHMLVVASGLILLGAFGEAVFRKTGIGDANCPVGARVLLGPAMHIVSADLLRPAVP